MRRVLPHRQETSGLHRWLLLASLLLIWACAAEPAPQGAIPPDPTEPGIEASAGTRIVALPAAPGASRRRAADGMEMVWIGSGKFLMGSDESPYAAERPEHTVALDGYWIDRFEVTNLQFLRCTDAGICSGSAALADPYRNDDRQPALTAWDEAAAYCGWVGARLPTEAEWEKAARGRGGRLWPWGHEFDARHANLSGGEDGFKQTAPVGSFPSGESPYGLLDMAGNAAEWVSDFYDPGYYEISPSRNPVGPAAGESHVYRSTIANGGGGPEKSRAVARYGGRLDWEYGFRCASSGGAPTKLRQTAAVRSPLAKLVPPAVVPVAAAAAGLSLLALWNLLTGLGMRVLRMMLSDKVVTRIRKADIDPEFRGFRFGGVKFKAREWVAILVAASVFAASLSFLYLQPEASVVGFLLLTITVNMLVYSARHLTRVYLDKKYGLDTEYKMWLWGALITAFSGYLGNTFGLAGYIVGGGGKHSGRVNYTCNVVSFTAFAAFWVLNWFSPSVLFQMVMLLAISITFLQMLPFSPFDGKSIYQWKRRLWWVSFVPLSMIYALTMLVLKR